MPKNAPTTAQWHSSHASKVMLKILQARLQQYVNHELLHVQAGFRKGRGEKERYLLEFRVPKNSKEKIRKPSSGINTKK